MIMSTPINTFVTTNHNDFTWPNIRPLMIVPSRPPQNVSTNNYYLPRPDPDECQCNYHSRDTDFSRYKELINHGTKLRNDIIKNNHEMTALLSRILDNSCEPEEVVMKSVYQVAHEQSGATITPYRSLMAAANSSISPIKPVVRQLLNGYQNPSKFRYSTKEIPPIESSEPINLKREPEMFSTWNESFLGRSEYTDTIGKLGISNSKNRKQYLEPIPSSRRRWGNRDP